MICKDVRAALYSYEACKETEDGARLTTHCLYPSFEPVEVFVARYGSGFRVHDAGGAVRAAWIHGRDDALITRMLNRYAGRFHVKIVGDSLVVEAIDAQWLTPAILAVANASAAVAAAAVEHIVAASENLLREKIFGVLRDVFPLPDIAKDYSIRGKSGKKHSFDFSVHGNHQIFLIDAVTPHHISIAAKYVAFSDVVAPSGAGAQKYAVHDRPLEPDDVSLLQQVADIVPFRALELGIRRVLSHEPSRFS